MTTKPQSVLEFEPNRTHECGEAMLKHKPLNNPYEYQLGFLDGYNQGSMAPHVMKLVEALRKIIERNRKEFHENVCEKSMSCHCRLDTPPLEALKEFEEIKKILVDYEEPKGR